MMSAYLTSEGTDCGQVCPITGGTGDAAPVGSKPATRYSRGCIGSRWRRRGSNNKKIGVIQIIHDDIASIMVFRKRQSHIIRAVRWSRIRDRLIDVVVNISANQWV